MPFLLDLGYGDFENRRLDGFDFFGFALHVQSLQPHVVLLVHVVLDSADRDPCGRSIGFVL
jgi:hypothetical protein